MTSIHPTTLKFQVAYWFRPASFTDILNNPQLNIVDEIKTKQVFEKLADELYIPLCQFILEHSVPVNIILTAEFAQMSTQHPKLGKLLTKVINQNFVRLVCDTFYGESLTALYNQETWQASLIQSYNEINKIFSKKVCAFYLPQIFRTLELERLQETGINSFIVQRVGKKYSTQEIMLSDLRRMLGKQISWINEIGDYPLRFHCIPDTDFFVVNGNTWQPNLQHASKTFNFAVGYASSQYLIRQDLSKLRTQSVLRLSEKPSLTIYNDIAKSCVRLFDYGQRLISSTHNLTSQEKNEIFKDFQRLQTPEFLYKTEKSLYMHEPSLRNFTSPYEAWAFVQSRIKQIEILTK